MNSKTSAILLITFLGFTISIIFSAIGFKIQKNLIIEEIIKVDFEAVLTGNLKYINQGDYRQVVENLRTRSPRQIGRVCGVRFSDRINKQTILESNDDGCVSGSTKSLTAHATPGVTVTIHYLRDSEKIEIPYAYFTVPIVFTILFVISMTFISANILSFYIRQVINVLNRTLISDEKITDVPIELRGVQKEIMKIANESADLRKRLIENTKAEAITQIALQVAHDIRSPISTLNLLAARISDPEIRSIQMAVVSQINYISNTLLNKSKVLPDSNKVSNSQEFIKREFNKKQGKIENSLLEDLLINLKSEFTLKASSVRQEIVFDVDYSDLNSVDHLSPEFISVIYTSICNFVQNSIEATEANGKITISAWKIGGKIEISVSDNGKGIPLQILERLGNEKLSYDKHSNVTAAIFNSGSGIALFNAKAELKRFGASLSIYSELGKGTTISISI